MPRQPSRRLLVLALALGCSQSTFLKRTDKAIATTFAATNAARDEFVAWDGQHQLDIVARSKAEGVPREVAEARLAAYRETRGYVLKAFVGAYTAVGAAAALVPLVEKGLRPERDLLGLIAAASSAITELRRALHAIRETPE